MAEKSIGTPGRTGLVIGEVINRKDDPTQTGQCKVRWDTGTINQSDLVEKDLPWSKSMTSKHSASLRGVGGPHTGYLEGSKVYGISISGDGQDMIIIGSVVSGGKGDIDGKPEYNSDIPHTAKSEKNDQVTQPKYGDKNGVVEDYKEKSVVEYAGEQAGPEKTAAKYKDLDDSAGTVGGSEGPDGSSTNTIISA